VVDFKIDFGPWDSVFEGKAYGHSVEIVANRENFYLVFIYEEIQGKKIGALVEGYKALVCKGNMEAFINTFPKQCMGVLKTLGDKTQKVFFVSFEPTYLDFNSEDYLKKLDVLLKENMDGVNTIVELARASSLELKELGQSSIKDYFQIIGDPFVMRVLLSPKRSSGLTKLELKDSLPEEKAAKIQLGMTKNRELVMEKSRNLYRTAITGSQEKAISYALYIIAENLLLEGKQIIVFDRNNYFDGLSRASKNDLILKENLVEYEPAGFPAKKIKAKIEMKVSLKETNLHLLLDTIGCFDESVEKGILPIYETSQFDSPTELLGFIEKMDSLNDFQKLKAERIIRIIDAQYNGLFGKSIEIGEVIKNWTGTLGRATIIDIKDLSEPEKIIFTQAAISYFDKSIKSEGTSDTSIIISKADSLLSSEFFIGELLKLEHTGFGFIMGSEKPIPEEIEKIIQTKMTAVAKNDFAVNSFNNPSYRVILRPSISGEPKYE